MEIRLMITEVNVVSGDMASPPPAAAVAPYSVLLGISGVSLLHRLALRLSVDSAAPSP